MKREIFTLLINCYESHEVNCDGTIYRQILFDGSAKGLPCRIFIENTAALGSPDTFPKCFSDSENLKWLKDADLRGRMINDEEGFKIAFYAS